MAKKVWYEIELISVKTSESEIVARVKSKGLAQIVYNQIKETYKNNNDFLVSVK